MIPVINFLTFISTTHSMLLSPLEFKQTQKPNIGTSILNIGSIHQQSYRVNLCDDFIALANHIMDH